MTQVHFYDNFWQDVGGGHQNLVSHTYRVILVNDYTFDSTHEDYSDVSADEIANGFGYVTGGTTIGSLSFLFYGGVTTWDGDNATWTATGGDIGPATGAIIYDDSATTPTANRLVCFIDFEGEETAEEDTDFKVVFADEGILTVAPVEE